MNKRHAYAGPGAGERELQTKDKEVSLKVSMKSPLSIGSPLIIAFIAFDFRHSLALGKVKHGRRTLASLPGT